MPPPPAPPPGTQPPLIPVTGVDLSLGGSTQFSGLGLSFINMGIVMLGLGLISHSMSMRVRKTDPKSKSNKR
jgi:hypothetical protein